MEYQIGSGDYNIYRRMSWRQNDEYKTSELMFNVNHKYEHNVKKLL